MMSGEGDISFAGTFGLLTVVFAMLSNSFNSFWISYLVVTALAVSVYLMIAFLVTRLNTSSFIASIAVFFMANGVEKALHQQTTLIQDQSIRSFSTMTSGLPLVVWLMALAYASSYFVVNKTHFGFSLRIVGENRDAAVEAGISGRYMKVSAYVIAGILLGLAASVESTRVGAIYEQGKYYMLPCLLLVSLDRRCSFPVE